MDTQATTDFKNTEVGMIPLDWDVVKLAQIVKLTMGQSPPSSTYNNDGIGLPFFQGKAEFGTVYPLVEKWCSQPQRIAQANSVLISVRAPVGDVNIAPYDCCIGRGLASITATEESTSLYLFYLFQFSKSRLEESGTGSIFKSINKEVLYNFLVPFPPLPEQRRIAAVLNAIQQSIAAQEDVIAATRQFKRSLMQRLFTYGPGQEPAETKETEIGEIPAHWKVISLEKVLDETQYGINNRAELSGTYPVLRMNNLVDGKIHIEDLKYVNLQDAEFSRYRLNQNDILFNRTNSYDLVGKTAIFELEGEYTFASYLVRVVPKSTELIPKYLNYCLNYEETQARLKKFATRGVSQSNISPTKLKQLVIGLPGTPEQSTIVEMLAIIDAKIAAEEDRKTALQTLFKSMLQQLMTGQIRLLSDEGLPLCPVSPKNAMSKTN